MATRPNRFIAVEEYLQQEESAVERHQYFDGEIFAMSGGTPSHSWIATNIIAALHPLLKNTGCRAANGDLGAKTPEGLYTYPDAAISCKPESFDGNFLLNPVAIFEVLSETTEAYDRGKKFEKYRRIDSFREHILVAQDRVYVEQHVRSESLNEPIWSMREFTSVDDAVALDSVNGRLLPLQFIYAEVTLP